MTPTLEKTLAQLETTSFAQYAKTLSAFRKVLGEGPAELPLEDFKQVLRPFYWYLHAPGFQDVYDAAWRAMECLQTHKDVLIREDNFLGVVTFLGNYCDEAERDTTGFVALYGAVEIVTQLAVEGYAEKLQELRKPAADIKALRAIAALLADVYGSRHDAYFILRVVGDQHLEHLRAIIHALDGDAATFVLHALDAFKGNPKVVRFYEDYLKALKRQPLTAEQRDALGRAAQKYLERVQPEKRARARA